MTNKIQRWRQLAKLPLATAVAASISAPANAFQFYLGDVEGSLDTTLSAGASWRVEDRDENLLSQGNLGIPQYSERGSSTSNTDDGNWNFKEGETYSKIIKGTTDLMLRYEDFGGFTRARYYYDFELKQEGRSFDNVGQTRPLNDEALEAAGADVEILDAYVWGDFYFGETPLNVRLGKQVVSWGESTFILGGVNTINPIDVSAVRAPGAEVKEALLPVNMGYLSLGVTEDITLEAFVQFEWEKTRPDPCGTFFASNDFAPDGCGPVILAGQIPESLAIAQGFFADRRADKEPDDTDQFGAALRWYAADLGDTEFGAYYIRYHSRLPYVSGVVNDPANGIAFPSYFVDYPEGIELYGVSFNTSTDGGWSIAGEITHRPNLPLQANAFEIIFAGLQLPYSQFIDRALPGQEATGYDRFKVSQAQMTLIKFFDQILGASRLTLVGEIGGTFVHDLPGEDEARYGRDSTFGIGPFEFDTIDPNTGTPITLTCKSPSADFPTNNNPKNCVNDGYTTDFSWGYRMRVAIDYNDIFAGINLTPTISWSHDVSGYGPEPGAQFREGSMAAGLSLRAVYLNKYTATIGYSSFFGGEPFNLINDRDNAFASVSFSF